MSRSISHILEKYAKLVCMLEPSDRTAMKAFLVDYFHPKYILINDSFFDWQYRENPYNTYKDYAVKILKMKDEFMGYLGLIPWKLKVFDKVYDNSGGLCNLMIGNKCRALGLGSVLVKECQRDFAILSGTSYKPKTKPMYEKLGNWFAIGNLSRYVLILNPQQCAVIEDPMNPDYRKFEDLAKRSVGSAFTFDKYRFFDIDKFEDDIDELWRKIRNDYSITVERSKDYLNWRFANHPQLKYLISVVKRNGVTAGYLVARIEKTREFKNSFVIGRIIDFVADAEARDALLNYFISKMKHSNVDFVDFLFAGRYHTETLKKNGFLEADEFKLTNIPYVFQPIERYRKHINCIIYISDKLMHLADKIKNIDNWYLTRADGDQDRPNISPD